MPLGGRCRSSLTRESRTGGSDAIAENRVDSHCRRPVPNLSSTFCRRADDGGREGETNCGSALPLETAQYRRWHNGYRHHRQHYGTNAAVLGGLAAGAIIGGAIANSRAQANDTVAYCAQRYRSYDVASAPVWDMTAISIPVHEVLRPGRG